MSRVRFVVPRSWRAMATFSELSCEAATVGAALDWFCGQYPMLRQRVFTGEGAIAPWTLICLDDVDVRSLAGLQTAINADAEIHLVPALMGG